MSRRAYPPDDVTAGEWLYLLKRYPKTEAEERRERIGFALRRLTRNGQNPRQLHAALMHGIDRWEAHRSRLMSRTAARKLNGAVARAQKDVDRALRSLRALMGEPRITPELEPFSASLHITDDDLWLIRDVLLKPVEVPPATRPRGGRPSEWKDETDVALRRLGVPESDRRELLTALGFAREA